MTFSERSWNVNDFSFYNLVPSKTAAILTYLLSSSSYICPPKYTIIAQKYYILVSIILKYKSEFTHFSCFAFFRQYIENFNFFCPLQKWNKILLFKKFIIIYFFQILLMELLI